MIGAWEASVRRTASSVRAFGRTSRFGKCLCPPATRGDLLGGAPGFRDGTESAASCKIWDRLL